jgi:hypothetical protein
LAPDEVFLRFSCKMELTIAAKHFLRDFKNLPVPGDDKLNLNKINLNSQTSTQPESLVYQSLWGYMKKVGYKIPLTLDLLKSI